jgi:tetratricopeptide (TPR) repeat protein
MTGVVLAVSVLLAAVAAAGVLSPFRRARLGTLEPITDPLEDERDGLLRALRDLEQERATGLLAESDYRDLRTETERRAVTVLRALEARDGAGRFGADLHELRGKSPVRGNGAPSRRGRGALPVVVAIGVVAAVSVPLLAGAVRNRSAGQPATGDTQNPIQFYLDRVTRFPQDLAARLDLANAYLQVGDVKDSVDQYLSALKIDPRNPEAMSTLGFLLYKGGNAQEGLDAVEKALSVVPNYPQGLYFKGVILLEGLNRPDDAAAALRAYLAAATFDVSSRRRDAQRLLAKAEQESQNATR